MLQTFPLLSESLHMSAYYQGVRVVNKVPNLCATEEVLRAVACATAADHWWSTSLQNTIHPYYEWAGRLHHTLLQTTCESIVLRLVKTTQWLLTPPLLDRMP